MKKNMTFHKKKIWVVFVCCILMMSGLIGRLVYLMCFRSDHYYEKAKDLHERERDIKAARGKIWMQKETCWHQTGQSVRFL